MKVAPEIVGVQEQENPPARLVADERFLLRRGGAGEEERGGAGRSAGRRDEGDVGERIPFLPIWQLTYLLRLEGGVADAAVRRSVRACTSLVKNWDLRFGLRSLNAHH